MTPAQCRAARGLLNWTQVKLAKAAGIGTSIVTSFTFTPASDASRPIVRSCRIRLALIPYVTTDFRRKKD